MTTKPNILILGAGPAGLGAASQLVRKDLASVTVIEQNESVGGIAGSFKISGINVDYGSHRLHPACDPEILEDLRVLLDGDLMVRQRHGRIRLCNRWIHFPLKPINLALKLPFSFSVNTAIDIARKSFGVKKQNADEGSFATVLESGLGRTICREFYFPYVQKIWGMSPEKISPTQAQRRVSANSVKKMIRKIFAAIPGFRQPLSGMFYYPKEGFGQICDRLYYAGKSAGVKFFTGARVTSLKRNGDKIDSVAYLSSDGQAFALRPDYVWSTIPIPNLLELLYPPAAMSNIDASRNIQYRAMVLVYLTLEQARFSEYDAHYFPDLDIPITRISEPKNYSGTQEPCNLTVLCAELPCSTNSPEWNMTDMELGEIVCDSLRRASIPITTSVKNIVSRRITYAYPIYHKDYKIHFDHIENKLSQVQNLLSFGRQGLFAHDNTHHALYMAYAAVNCLNNEGQFDRNKWQCHYKKVFNSHVVED